MSTTLRAKIIRLAAEDQTLKPHLLRLLQATKVEFDTLKYERQNYVKVTPALYGTWEFQMGDPQVGDVFVVRSSPYGDAQRRAEAEAHRRGVTQVTVLP